MGMSCSRAKIHAQHKRLVCFQELLKGGKATGGEKVVPRRVPSNMFLKILFFGFSAGVGLFHREALCCHSFFTTARSGSPAARRPGELEARLPT